jgi:hypothetical protein
MGGFISSIFNPIKTIGKVFGHKSSAEKRAEEQRKQYEAQAKRNEANRSQSQRKEHGTDADLSDLPGMGDVDAGGGIETGLSGLGGVSEEELKLQKRKPLGG